LFSRVRPSRFCHCDECGCNAVAVVAAAADMEAGVTDGACLILLDPPIGLTIGLLVFSCQMWKLGTWAT
jgi:hypothetical protein